MPTSLSRRPARFSLRDGAVATGRAITIALVATCPSFAATLAVRPDGSGDFTAIQAAVDAAVDGDVLDIGAGTYQEQVVVSKSIDLIGASGASATTIDGNHATRALTFVGDLVANVEGLTLANGDPTPQNSGGGLRVESGAVVTARECVLADNQASFGGAGFFVWTGAHLSLEDCEIRGNHAGEAGGAGLVSEATASLSGCHIHLNTCDLKSAGVDTYLSSVNVTGCLFEQNVSANVSGGLRFERTTGTLSSSTFDRNSSPGPDGGTVVVYLSPNTIIERCIFARDLSGVGISYLDDVSSRSCNLFWNNAEGPVAGDAIRPDDFSGNPLFCNADGGDFHVAELSPAAASGNSCGVGLGAYPVACGSLPIESQSWGQVKGAFRR
ncbi:MAG: right-handed parallel beta-helix repeat-containing protein [Gemmatimonadetes bacterium]|nr:right-handed parallel beta-helix repeat-containing protein [Gemmatimonadota bacterium]